MSRFPLALLLALASAFAGEASHAANQRLTVVFVGDGSGPMALIEVQERGEGQRIERAAAWAFFAGSASVSKAMSDRVRGSRQAPPLADLPAAPAALGLTSDVDGTLLFTLDELGDWQDQLEAGRAPAAEGPPVSAGSSARLLVEPPPSLAPTGRYTTRATVYGTRGAYTGLAVVETRPEAGDGGGALVSRVNDELVLEPFGSEERSQRRAFIADRARACERPVPTAVLLWPEEGAPARLSASAAPICLPGGRAVVALEGARLEPRRDTPMRGLLLDEAAAPGARKAPRLGRAPAAPARGL